MYIENKTIKTIHQPKIIPFQVLRHFLLVVILFCCNFAVQAQTGSIKGFVYEKATGESVPFCNVFLEGTQYGGSTDINGYFNLSKIPPGNYTFKVSELRFKEYSEKITIKEEVILTKKVFLETAAMTLDDITISADAMSQQTDIKASIVKITPKQIARIPSMGSEPDLAQYLQVLPGVIFTGDQGGQLYIRGGSPIQNKVLLDGMVVYNPFHSIGLFSVFDSDIMRNADIYTGGFSAEYGGRISSIMDISMRDGNKTKFAGKASVSTFGSKLMLEGPLKKFSPNSKGSASYIFSGKTSYLEQSSKVLYNYIDTSGLPFNFTDLYGKISINGNSGSKLNLFGFRFSDQVRYQAVSDLNWKAYGAGGNIILAPAASTVLIKMNFSYSKYAINLKEDAFIAGAEERVRSSQINNYTLALSFLYFIGEDELDYGLETNGFNTTFNFNNSLRNLSQDENTTEMGGYLKYKKVFGKKKSGDDEKVPDAGKNEGKLLIEPSFRLQWYASLDKVSPEPRLGVKYKVTRKVRIKGAGGLYSQNLISANSDRDIVNLFYGFLSGPDDLQVEFEGKEVTHSLQTAWHAILGVEYDLTNRININLEGYYKKNTQLTNINRNKIYDDTPENYQKQDYFKKDFIIEDGDAYGADILIKYDYKRVYLWCVYSLGYVNRNDGVIQYHPHFDRRHNVNLLGTITFGKNLNWEAGVRWNLGSGFPFTRTKGFYERVPFEDGIMTDYTTSNGEMGITYGQLNQGRLPTYHRLDANVKYKQSFAHDTELEVSFSITNLYNRENIFYFDRIKHERVNQLPIMPSIGMNLAF